MHLHGLQVLAIVAIYLSAARAGYSQISNVQFTPATTATWSVSAPGVINSGNDQTPGGVSFSESATSTHPTINASAEVMGSASHASKHFTNSGWFAYSAYLEGSRTRDNDPPGVGSGSFNAQITAGMSVRFDMPNPSNQVHIFDFRPSSSTPFNSTTIGLGVSSTTIQRDYGISGVGSSSSSFDQDFDLSVTMWSINDAPFPGLSPEEALPSTPSRCGDCGKEDEAIEDNFDEDEDEPVERSTNVAGANLRAAVPVESGGYGNTQTVYIDPELAIGYGYHTNDTNRFRSYEIPEPFPQGDANFSIHYQGEAYPLAAGDTFDFTTLDPTGVESFLLLGIDETELLDPESTDPFIYGVTFMEAGFAEIVSFPLVSAIPEPSGMLLGVMGVLLAIGNYRRR